MSTRISALTRAIGTAGLLAGFSGTVAAAGFALIEQSGSGIGNAFAGAAAAAEDASTIFYNPAGMTLLPDSQLVASAHAIRPSAEFNNAGATTATMRGLPAATGLPQALTGGNGGDAGDWALVPNIYYARAITPRLRVGLGLNAPFGLRTDYDPGWVGRYEALRSELKTVNINPSVAFKVNDQISLAAGFSAMRAYAELSKAVDFGSITCLGATVPVCAAVPALRAGVQSNDGVVEVKGEDWGYGFNLGMLVELREGTRFGLSYRSQVFQEIDGDVRFVKPALPPALAGNPAFQNGSVIAKVTLPDTFSGSFYHQINDQWAVMADGTWTHWNKFQTLTVSRTSGPLAGTVLDSTPENWKNAWRGSVGTTYQYNDALKLRAGFAVDESPVPDAFRTPRIPDEDRYWLAVGGQYRFSQHSAVDFGYVHIFVKDSSLDVTNRIVPTAPIPTRRLTGKYDNEVNILSVQYTHTF